MVCSRDLHLWGAILQPQNHSQQSFLHLPPQNGLGRNIYLLLALSTGDTHLQQARPRENGEEKPSFPSVGKGSCGGEKWKSAGITRDGLGAGKTKAVWVMLRAVHPWCCLLWHSCLFQNIHIVFPTRFREPRHSQWTPRSSNMGNSCFFPLLASPLPK